MPKRNVVASVLILFVASGCGTMVNLKGDYLDMRSSPQVFGGATLDAQIAARLPVLTEDVAYDVREVSPLVALPLGAYLVCIDMPLSAIGDTLTLPYVLYLKSHKGDAPAASQGTAPSSAIQHIPYERVEGSLE